MSQIGRPPKVQRQDISALPRNFVDSIVSNGLVGSAPAAEIVWHQSRESVLKAACSVGGIAQLSGANRKTVTRRGIATGSLQALQFIRAEREKRGLTPIVRVRSEKGPIYPSGDERLDRVIKFAVGLRRGYTTKQTVRAKGAKRRGRGIADMVCAATESQETAERAKRGLVVVYNPHDRITLKMVCSFLGLSRVGLWKWRNGLTQRQGKLLQDALNVPRKLRV